MGGSSRHMVGRCRLDSCVSGWGPISGFCECDDEPLDSLKDGGSFWPALWSLAPQGEICPVELVNCKNEYSSLNSVCRRIHLCSVWLTKKLVWTWFVLCLQSIARRVTPIYTCPLNLFIHGSRERGASLLHVSQNQRAQKVELPLRWVLKFTDNCVPYCNL